MDDELPLYRNPNLKVVPQEQSVTRVVDQNWERVQKCIYDAIPFEAHIRNIESILAQQRAAIVSEMLPQEFDWRFDLASAQFNHRFNLGWIEYYKTTRTNWEKYWERVADTSNKFAVESLSGGLKALLLVHGAAAVGAINVIANKTNVPGNYVVGTSKFVLFAAIIGMALAAGGQIIATEILASSSAKIRAHLASKLRWSKFKALGRFQVRAMKNSIWAERMIYGSAGWFCFYALVVAGVLAMS